MLRLKFAAWRQGALFGLQLGALPWGSFVLGPSSRAGNLSPTDDKIARALHQESGLTLSELIVPFAIDNHQNLFGPDAAEKGREYFCPACHVPLSFRQGGIRARHFAHRSSKTCQQETITHITAKLLIQQAVRDWKSGNATSPVLQRKCQHCSSPISQPLPKSVEQAVVEQRLPDNSIVDVALVAGDRVLAAIEVQVTHAVDSVKAERLPVPFIELDGVELVENSTIWRPIADNLKPVTCGKCHLAYKRLLAKAKQVAAASGQVVPTAYYRYGITACWSCERAIIVYTWPSDEQRGAHMPTSQPVPNSIQYRATKRMGRCWVNTCPHCQSVQEPHYLYLPTGPFFSVSCDEDSDTAYTRDMMRISRFAAQLQQI